MSPVAKHPVAVAIVEREDALRHALVHLLSLEFGLALLGCPTTQDLFESLEDRIPAVIIVGDDPTTPDGTGLTVRLLESRYPRAAIVTLWESPPAHGGNAMMLQKNPLDSHELIAVVTTLLQQSVAPSAGTSPADFA